MARKQLSATEKDRQRRMKWWHEARFGMFIHWGLYSVLGRHEWAMEMEGSVFMDSSAALGMVKRKGNGKMRHIRVGMLWIQQKAEEEELRYKKVDGKENPGDLMTKHVPQAVAEKLVRALSLVLCGGRSSSSLRV